MAQLIIKYWRDMPAMVTVKAGRKQAKRPLPERFEKAIDAAAMRGGMDGTDDYLSEWRNGDPLPVEGDLESEADKALADIDTSYTPERLRALIANDGNEPAGD